MNQINLLITVDKCIFFSTRYQNVKVEGGNTRKKRFKTKLSVGKSHQVKCKRNSCTLFQILLLEKLGALSSAIAKRGHGDTEDGREDGTFSQVTQVWKCHVVPWSPWAWRENRSWRQWLLSQRPSGSPPPHSAPKCRPEITRVHRGHVSVCSLFAAATSPSHTGKHTLWPQLPLLMLLELNKTTNRCCILMHAFPNGLRWTEGWATRAPTWMPRSVRCLNRDFLISKLQEAKQQKPHWKVRYDKAV